MSRLRSMMPVTARPAACTKSADQQLGMTPATYGKGGAGERIAFTIADSALGKMLVAATQRGLCAVRFGDDAKLLERELREEFHAAEIRRDDAGLREFVDSILSGLAAQKTLWTCLSTSGRRPSSKRYGALCGRFLPERPVRTPRSRRTSATPRPPGQSREPAPPIRSLSLFHATAWFAKTETWPGYRWGVQRKEELLRRERGAEERVRRR